MTPTATFQPEIRATKPDDVLGVWLLHVVGQGGLVRFDTDFTFKADNTYDIFDTTGGMHIEGGTYRFVGGNLVLDSDECYVNATATFFHCVGTYTVYSTKQGDVNVRLRFVTVDDSKGGDRALNLKNKTLVPAQR
jgi:hypothetical protein